MTKDSTYDPPKRTGQEKNCAGRVSTVADRSETHYVPAGAAARGRRAWERDDEEGAAAARAMTGAAAAVEKNALVFFALFSALRERRCTPREVSMLDDVGDDEVGGNRASQAGPV